VGREREDDLLLGTKTLLSLSLGCTGNCYCHNVQEQSQIKIYPVVTTKDSLKTAPKDAQLETTRCRNGGSQRKKFLSWFLQQLEYTFLSNNTVNI